MIFDDFKNIHRYSTIPFLQDIIQFVKSRDCLNVPDGEHEILGRDLFVRVAEYPTGSADEKMFEAHKIYADLQLIIKGREVMDISLEAHPRPVTEYETAADIRFFENPEQISSWLVSEGEFTVFFPGELHKPGCHPLNGLGEKVKKFVFKIRMN